VTLTRSERSVCIGDFWAASEGLDDLIIRIGRMIAFQEYNTKSPLNGLAAKWTSEHSHLLPIDSRNISPANIAQEGSALIAAELQPSSQNQPPKSIPSVAHTADRQLRPEREDPWTTKIIIR
jgi:hypothetical protein